MDPHIRKEVSLDSKGKNNAFEIITRLTINKATKYNWSSMPTKKIAQKPLWCFSSHPIWATTIFF